MHPGLFRETPPMPLKLMERMLRKSELEIPSRIPRESSIAFELAATYAS